MATDFQEIGEAVPQTTPNLTPPRQTELPQAKVSVLPGGPPPAATSFPQATGYPEPTHIAPEGTELPQATAPALPCYQLPAATSLGGLTQCDTRQPSAAQSSSDDGQSAADTLTNCAIVGNLSIEVRRYEDLRRAHQRLLLQAMSMCRYACDGDKVAGAKLYSQIVKEPGHPLSVWLIPYFEAMKPLETAIRTQEKTVSKLARELPVWGWAKSISGLSDRFLGLIVGECGAPVGDFRNPSCVWKRMGLAVIDGGRQRKVAGDAAITHGYVARRRALMWNIGDSIIKQQVRKGEDDARFPIGQFGAVYLERKVYELTKTDKPCIAHNRAKRYMEKRLLRELWKAWLAA